ncbi:MAG: hypothetical protein ABIO70_20905 [Pseudomonadota bacterium]
MSCRTRPPSTTPVDKREVGGDCDNEEEGANRGETEGPNDLLGLYWGEPADCSTCLDGIDNNCNGLMDCAEPACADCFIGQGVGCGGGGDSPCLDAGCAASRAGRQLPGTALALALMALAGAVVRWRVRR